MPSQERLPPSTDTAPPQVSTSTTTATAQTQAYGNAAAQEGLPVAPQGEPVNITAYDAMGDHVITEGRLVQQAMGDEVAPFSAFDAMADSILAQAGDRQIGTLKIIAHASTGEMMLGEGQDMDVIDTYSMRTDSANFGRLTGHFAPDGHVEIHGCEFAQTESGELFLSRLSALWGVPVSAGRQVQWPFTPGLDGTTVTAGPDGKGGTALTEDPGSLDRVLQGAEALSDGVDWMSSEVGDLWTWIFGEES